MLLLDEGDQEDPKISLRRCIASRHGSLSLATVSRTLCLSAISHPLLCQAIMYGSVPQEEIASTNNGHATGCRKFMTDRKCLYYSAFVALFLVLLGLVLDEAVRGRATYLRNGFWSRQKYTHIQTLSLDISTGPAPALLANNVSNPECHSAQSVGTQKTGSTSPQDVACYVGLANLTEDVKRRIVIMTKAVDAAYEMSSKDEGTLKVFLVPEFYFRGPYGAYVLHTKEANTRREQAAFPISQIAAALENIVQQAKFKDWFFVFGTVVGVDKSFHPNDVENEREFINFSLMYKGGDPAGSSAKGMRFVAPKTYVSKIDFLSPQRDSGSTIATDPDDIGHEVFDSKKLLDEAHDLLEAADYDVIPHNWFRLDGILFSIEICLDHRLGLAVRSFLNYGLQRLQIPQGGDAGLSYGTMTKLAQVSLIISAGMVINEHNLVLRKGGAVFISDGDDGEDTVWTREPGTDDFMSIYTHYNTFPNVTFPWGREKPYFPPGSRGVFSEALTTPRILDYGTFAIAS